MPWHGTDGDAYINAPINTNIGGDLQKALKTTYNGDIGETIKRAADNNRINIWAKYKPMRRTTKVTPFTEAELKALNYGLSVTKFTDAASLIAGITNNQDWAYDKPTGASGEKYCLFDLINPNNNASVGYNANAKSFFLGLQAATSYTKGTGDLTFSAHWNKDNNLPAGSIALSDLSDMDGQNINISTFYFGVLLTRTSGGTTSYLYLTTSEQIGSNNYITDLTIPAATMSGLDAGNWNAYFFVAKTMCTTPQTNVGTINNTYLRNGAYSLPEVGVQPLEVIASSSTANASIVNLVAHAGTSAMVVAEFDILYRATSGTHTIYASYEIYGAYEMYGKDVLWDNQNLTLTATTTTQTQHVTYSGRKEYPAYVTVVFSYRIDSDTVPSVYEESVPYSPFIPD